jgi:ribosomal protein S18 acetylase RimI-like enzyme
MLIADGFDEPVEQAYDLICAVYRSSPEFSTSLTEAFPDLASFRDFLSALKQRAGSVFLIAKQDHTPSGFLIFKPRPQARLSHAADLNMGVLPAFRGHGIGHQLLGHACAQAVDEGLLEILYLMVRADNQAALHLYEKNGFEQKAVLNNDTKIGDQYFDGILMAKDLVHTDPHEKFGGSLQMGGNEELHPRSP